MVHAARYPAFALPRLDPVRIFGYATAIAVHVALLMLLLVPVTAPPVVPTLEDFRIVWVPAEKKAPPPPPPIEVPVVKRQPHSAPRPVAMVPPQPPVQRQAVQDDQGSEPVAVIAPPHDPVVPPADTGPLAGVQLEYASAPAPAYPREALREGLQGSVLLKVLVDVDGRPLDVQVARSSGHRALDRAAREQVLRRWTFRPAMRDGRAVQAIGLVPVDFRLE
ncbi:MAG TPA: energy transducer TonB [Xanthomonadaceae bacterium]|jgi:protein TonB|nr:energy transducer TonB [Xanthomonadaceae bacterium]